MDGRGIQKTNTERVVLKEKNNNSAASEVVEMLCNGHVIQSAAQGPIYIHKNLHLV